MGKKITRGEQKGYYQSREEILIKKVAQAIPMHAMLL